MKRKFFVPFILACALMSSCASQTVIEPTPFDDSLTIELDSTALQLEIGGTATLNAVVSDDEVAVTWVNSDSNVISVAPHDRFATITAKSTGTAYVTALAAGKSQYCTVTVGSGGEVIVVSNITLDQNDVTLDLKETLTLTATVTHEGSQPITWVSSDETVATVAKQDNRKALVTPKAVGKTVITAVSGNKTATCNVTVENFDEDTLAIKLDKTQLTLEAGKEATLTATVKPANKEVTWQSNDQGVATVANGKVTAVKVGTAVISASVTDGDVTKTATCNVTVTGSQEAGVYEQKIAAWSKPGHLYMHYLRNSDQLYSKWALWIWQNYPEDSEGSLWGANTTDYTLAVTAQTTGFMTNAQCGLAGNDMYIDDYGAVIDVDLTLLDIKGGKSGVISPLVYEDQWADEKVFNKLALGFLIVDQSKMTGEDMWVSDGGAEVYIKKIGKLLENGKDSYLHVYCVEGNVADYKTASGKQEVTNPTLVDHTGKYRSNNDITNLRYDAFTSGVSTSETFVNDRPGVGYQIFVPSFSDSDGDGFGDIKGITNKLDYLEDLGVDVLWLTPIQESNSYHGYDVTDYYKIDSRFGTLQDYQELIFKAHERGMKVLMDMVINHTSKSNVLYKKSQRAEVEIVNGKTINYRDMYLWKYKGDKVRVWDGQPAVDVGGGIKKANFVTANVESELVKDQWYKDGTSDYYYFGKFGSGMAELNYSCQATRDYMTDMCKYWLSFGLDGFRLDAIKHIYLLGELDPAVNLGNDYITYDVGWKHYYNPEMGQWIDVPNDYSYDRNLNVLFWKQFAGTIKSAYPNCFLVGENFDGWNERMAPFYESMDSQFDFQTYYALNEMKEDSIGSKIKDSIDVYRSYRGSSTMINGAFTSNHDVARMMNHAVMHTADVNAKYSGGDAKHHGEINSSNLGEALNQARYYSAISILTPGCSWIYYGDEIGLCGNTEDKVMDSKGNIVDDHGNNVDRWYRQPMRWTNTYGTGTTVKYQFSGMEVLWDNISNTIKTVPEQQNDPNSLLSYFKALTATKRDERFPTYGRVVNSGAKSEGVAMMDLTDGYRSVEVVINNTGSSTSFNYSGPNVVVGKSNGSSISGNTVTVGAHGFIVFTI